MRWLGQHSQRVGDHHVQIFIPSVDRDGQPVPQGQEYWVDEALQVLGTEFGGATAFPPAKGVWRDDEREGELVADRTVIVFSYASEEDLTGEGGQRLFEFAQRLGTEGKQGEVGIYVDRTYYGIQDFENSEREEEKHGEEATN